MTAKVATRIIGSQPGQAESSATDFIRKGGRTLSGQPKLVELILNVLPGA